MALPPEIRDFANEVFGKIGMIPVAAALEISAERLVEMTRMSAVITLRSGHRVEVIIQDAPPESWETVIS